ncbi:MAG: ATP-binding protein [Nitrospirae bacterium]|nr:ATP-binding protein [Nitrospirota bacterium]
MGPSSLTVIFPAEARWLAAIRALVEQSCLLTGFAEEVTYRVKLAVDEACTNIIRHSYSSRSGTITLDVEVGNGAMTFTLRDRGKPFSPEGQSDLPRELKPGGLGMPLIQQVMDEVEYSRTPGGENLLRMVKRLGRN